MLISLSISSLRVASLSDVGLSALMSSLSFIFCAASVGISGTMVFMRPDGMQVFDTLFLQFFGMLFHLCIRR